MLLCNYSERNGQGSTLDRIGGSWHRCILAEEHPGTEEKNEERPYFQGLTYLIRPELHPC